jgi:hypothetical protein
LIVTFHSLGEVLGRADIITSVFETFDDINMIAHNKKACLMNGQAAVFMAGVTRLELATSGLTGRRSNQTELHPQRKLSIKMVGGTGLEPVTLGL